MNAGLFQIRALTLALITCISTIFGCNRSNPSIEGAYELIRSRYGDSAFNGKQAANRKTIKVIKDGHWMVATFAGTQMITVERAFGGKYTLHGDSCLETLDFSSEEASELGTTSISTYRADKKYLQLNRKNAPPGCRDCPSEETYSRFNPDGQLLDTSMEGAWYHRESEWFGQKTEDPDYINVKLYAYPRFAWASYHLEGKDFIGVGGGTYHFDGKKLVEHLEYFSFYDIIPGDEKIDVTRLSPGSVSMVNTGSAGKEIYDKFKPSPIPK